MRFKGLALGIGVLLSGAVACGGNSGSQPATEQPTAGAGANLGGSAGAGVAGKPSQAGAARGGTGGTAGTAGQPPKSGCPMDMSSWTVETCYPIAAVPVAQPAASGGAGSGGATGEGGEGGASEPVCPAMPLPGPFDPPPVVKGDQCCYYRTQICG